MPASVVELCRYSGSVGTSPEDRGSIRCERSIRKWAWALISRSELRAPEITSHAALGSPLRSHSTWQANKYRRLLVLRLAWFRPSGSNPAAAHVCPTLSGLLRHTSPPAVSSDLLRGLAGLGSRRTRLPA